MLLLSDVAISRLCVQNHLIRPFDPEMLSGCSYDLRAGTKLRSRNREQSFDLDSAPYVIESGECVTLTTLETVDFREPFSLELGGETVTAYMSALILNKHTIVATGLFHPDTSVDPGFRGPLALTLMNFGPIGYLIHSMERIAKIVFVPIIMPVERVYGVTQVPSVREGDTNMALI